MCFKKPFDWIQFLLQGYHGLSKDDDRLWAMEIDREHRAGVLHHTHTPPHTHPTLGWTGIVDTVALPPPPGALPLTPSQQHNSLAGDPNGVPPPGNYEILSAVAPATGSSMAMEMVQEQLEQLGKPQLAGSELPQLELVTMMVCQLPATLHLAAGTADLGAVTATAHPLVPMATTTTAMAPATAGQPRPPPHLPVTAGARHQQLLQLQELLALLLSDQASPAPGSGGPLTLLRSGRCPMLPGSLLLLLQSMATLTTALCWVWLIVTRHLPLMATIMLTKVAQHQESGDTRHSIPRPTSCNPQDQDSGLNPPSSSLSLSLNPINPNQNYHQPQPDQKTFPLSSSGPTQHELQTQVTQQSKLSPSLPFKISLSTRPFKMCKIFEESNDPSNSELA